MDSYKFVTIIDTPGLEERYVGKAIVHIEPNGRVRCV